MRELLEEPVEREAGRQLERPLDVGGLRVAEGVGADVVAEAAVAHGIADDVAEEVGDEVAAAVGRRRVRAVGAVPVGVPRDRLGEAAQAKLGDLPRGGVLAGGHVEERLEGLAGRKLREALVHPRVADLVGAEHPVEPLVRRLVRRHADEAAGRAASRDEVHHRVLHPAVARLRDGELRPAVRPETLLVVGDDGRHEAPLRLPPCGDVRLVEKVVRASVRPGDAVVRVVAVGGPREVVDVLRLPAPRQARRFGPRLLAGLERDERLARGRVAFADLSAVLQHAGCADGVGGGEGDAHVEGAEGRVELTPDVGLGVPAAAVVLRHLGVPLRHREVDALAALPPRAARLQRHLRLERHREDGALAGRERARQVDAHDGVVDAEGRVHTVHRERLHALVADFVGRVVPDARHDAGVGVGEVAVALRHHRRRLEGVEVQVIEDLPERVGRVVLVGEALPPGVAVRGRVHVDVHLVGDALLPRRRALRQGGGGHGGGGEGRREGGGEEDRAHRKRGKPGRKSGIYVRWWGGAGVSGWGCGAGSNGGGGRAAACGANRGAGEDGNGVWGGANRSCTSDGRSVRFGGSVGIGPP